MSKPYFQNYIIWHIYVFLFVLMFDPNNASVLCVQPESIDGCIIYEYVICFQIIIIFHYRSLGFSYSVFVG